MCLKTKKMLVYRSLTWIRHAALGDQFHQKDAERPHIWLDGEFSIQCSLRGGPLDGKLCTCGWESWQNVSQMYTVPWVNFDPRRLPEIAIHKFIVCSSLKDSLWLITRAQCPETAVQLYNYSKSQTHNVLRVELRTDMEAFAVVRSFFYVMVWS